MENLSENKTVRKVILITLLILFYFLSLYVAFWSGMLINEISIMHSKHLSENP
jgi:hypothetical protein